jgi:hypothetical protein
MLSWGLEGVSYGRLEPLFLLVHGPPLLGLLELKSGLFVSVHFEVLAGTGNFLTLSYGDVDWAFS